MSAEPWRPSDERQATDNAAAMVEWLRTVGAMPDATPERVRAAVATGDPHMLGHVARFCELDGDEEGWLRRHRGARVAVTRGPRCWTFDDLAKSDAAWREAGAPQPPVPRLLHAIATRLLLDEVRPDDTVAWHGAADDPLAWAPLALGAAIRLAAAAP